MFWHQIYWRELVPVLAPLAGPNLAKAYPAFAKLQLVLNTLLALPPLLYLVYLGFLAWFRRIANGAEPLLAMALRFAPSLIP